MDQSRQAFTVSAITRAIKSSLEERLAGIWVEGEISNYHLHSSGHRYITLKDDKAVLKVVLWRSVGGTLKFEPENGQKVLAYGDITVYERGGQYQLNCKRLEPVGIGELELAFRQLYEKLEAEGLFDPERKQLLPEYPERIGIVTSPTGAAIQDIMQIARRRNPSVELIIYPAVVQGQGAENTIAAGIRYFNSRNDIDIIITGRGGGSLEDLWAFNTEMVVRAIVESRVPVVSAVGHEIDTTLSDYAADLRAPTPSAAAELTIWSADEYRERLRSNLYSMGYNLNAAVEQSRAELEALLTRPVFARPTDMVYQRRQYLDHSIRLLESAGKNSFQQYRNGLSLRLSRLDGLSPLRILARGYSVTRQAESGQLVRRAGELNRGDRLETLLEKGSVITSVEEVNSKDRLS